MNISIRGIIAFLFLCLFLAYMGYVAHSFSQNERFVDEVGHFVGGHFVLQGDLLYRDLQFNHQPLVYYFSAIAEKITQPVNTYEYVARQREFIFVYGALYTILLFMLFGRKILFFSLIFETAVYALGGHKLLGELIAIYPVVYLTLLLFRLLMSERKRAISNVALFFGSVSAFLAVFSLLPQWPFVIGVGAMVCSKIVFQYRRVDMKTMWKKLTVFLLPALLLCGVLFSQVPHNDYIRETIVYNRMYLIPSLERSNSLLNILAFPLASVLPPYGGMQLVIATLVGMYVFLMYSQARKGGLVSAIAVTIALYLANIRIEVGSYNSFHLIPWFGALTSAVMYLVAQEFPELSKKISWKKMLGNKKLLTICAMLSVIFVYSLFQLPNPVSAKKHALTTHGVNYGVSDTYGRAISLMKQADDELFVVHNDPMIYWSSGVKHATRVLEYYSWIYTIPEYRNEIIDMFLNRPPAFVVDTGLNPSMLAEGENELSETVSIDQRILLFLDKEYVRVNHLDMPSMLYVRKDRVGKISQDVRDKLEIFHFQISEIPAEVVEQE